jgi:hypothetical protein
VTTFLITELHPTELAPERLPNIALVSRRAGATGRWAGGVTIALTGLCKRVPTDIFL